MAPLHIFNWQYQVEKGQVSSLPINKNVSLCSLDVVLPLLESRNEVYLHPSEPFLRTLGPAWTQNCWHKGGESRTGPFGTCIPQSASLENTSPRDL